MLISIDELKDRLDDEDTIIIDARDWHEYSKAHIPNALNLDLFAFHFFDTSKEGIDVFNKSMAMLLSSLGISYDKYVIFYDNYTGILAARGLWLMHYFNHYRCSILDGGFDEWKKRYGIETKPNTPTPSNFEPKINKSIIASLDDVLNAINDSNSIIIDARSRDEYDGRIVRAARGGHIPSAINIEWTNNIDKGRMKSIEDLKVLYNFDKNAKIICYCQGGYRAAHTYLALRLLGYDAKVYLGSWYEYGNRLDLPIE